MSLVTPPSLTRRRGLTLTEVLIAMGIFTVGFVAVASLVPAAIFLQRETVTQTNADAYAQSVRNQVQVLGFDDTGLANANDFEVARWDWNQVTGYDPGDPMASFTLADRSYPTSERVEFRTQFFVPLFMDTANDPVLPDSTTRSWRVYIFVTQAQVNTTPRGNERYLRSNTPLANSETITEWANPHRVDDWPLESAADPTNNDVLAITPGIAQIDVAANGTRDFDFDNNPRLIRPGDKILAGNDTSTGTSGAGVIYSVTEAFDDGVNITGTVVGDPDQLWFAHPGLGNRSTFVDLFMLVDNNGDLVFTPTP